MGWPPSNRSQRCSNQTRQSLKNHCTEHKWTLNIFSWKITKKTHTVVTSSIAVTLSATSLWFVQFYLDYSISDFEDMTIGQLNNFFWAGKSSFRWTFQNSFHNCHLATFNSHPNIIVSNSGPKPFCEEFQEDAGVWKWGRVLAWKSIKGRPTMVVTTTECSPHSDSRTFSVSPSLSGEDFSSLSNTSVEGTAEVSRSNRLSKPEGEIKFEFMRHQS